MTIQETVKTAKDAYTLISDLRNGVPVPDRDVKAVQEQLERLINETQGKYLPLVTR